MIVLNIFQCIKRIDKLSQRFTTMQVTIILVVMFNLVNQPNLNLLINIVHQMCNKLMYKEHQMSNLLLQVNQWHQIFKELLNLKDQEHNKFLHQIIDTILIKVLINTNIIFLVWLMSHGIDVFRLVNVEVVLVINVLLNNQEEELGIGIDFLFCKIFLF